jgi:Zn-dependent protease with chaperone function
LEVQGTYYFARSAKTCPAKVEIKESALKVFSDDGLLLLETEKSSVKTNLPISGVSSSLEFDDGSSFIPRDNSIRWFSDSLVSRATEKLASNVKIVSAMFIVCPLFIWFLIFTVIPNIGEYAANKVPEAPKGIISKNIMEYFSKNYFTKSEISYEERTIIKDDFFKNLDLLELNSNQYELLFYKADIFGANAFALPDGTIILTDEMVEKLQTHPNALLAILLHEVGHIENNHSIKQIIQSLGIGLIFTYLVGDVQGLSEIVTGSGLGLLQASFSREMEIEADQFSLEYLNKIGLSKKEFIFAMEAILKNDNGEDDGSALYAKYLSSHPHTEKRIELAKNY